MQFKLIGAQSSSLGTVCVVQVVPESDVPIMRPFKSEEFPTASQMLIVAQATPANPPTFAGTVWLVQVDPPSTVFRAAITFAPLLYPTASHEVTDGHATLDKFPVPEGSV